MGKILVDENNLINLANKIREKNNITDNLIFPDGFIQNIENIQGGDIITEPIIITPKEEIITSYPNEGIDGFSSVTVNAIPNNYIGTGVQKRSATTITPSESQQIIPAGVYLNGAQTINPIPDNYIIPSGSMTITSNGEVDVTTLAKVVVNIATGIIPIGDLTADLVTRPTGAGGGTITIPAGYYVKNELTISNWRSGQMSGNGTSGGTFHVPYSTIGFVPTYAALIANGDGVKAANTIIAVFGDNGSGRAINTGSKASLSTTYALETSGPKVTLNSNGITFPAISGKAYGKFNYRWFALR